MANTLTVVEKMLQKAKNQKYNKLIAKYQKLMNGGQNTTKETKADLDDYTRLKLVAAGFKIEVVEFNSFEVFKISW